ncbi:hypothetical protein EDB19DRAFT_1742839 [Suillus lakei]|nr:hypothetical protein EDB19DRAFT_1742839 [Suillus lakei]
MSLHVMPVLLLLSEPLLSTIDQTCAAQLRFAGVHIAEFGLDDGYNGFCLLAVPPSHLQQMTGVLNKTQFYPELYDGEIF